MRAANVKVLSNIKVSERYWHMIVDSSEIQETIEPGQFFNIRCGKENYPFLRRPFSVYRINKKQDTVEFLYLVKGLGTQKLTEIHVGENIDVFGPLGQGFTLDKSRDTIFLLARGVGIATLAALAQKAAAQKMNIVAILSARTRNDLLAVETLQGFGTEVYKVTDEEGTSDVTYVQKLIDNIFLNHDVKAAYTCGSKRLSRLLQKIVRKQQIFSEIALEEHMGCAMGVCFACVCDINEGDTIKTVRVCREGPVFPLQKVIIA